MVCTMTRIIKSVVVVAIFAVSWYRIISFGFPTNAIESESFFLPTNAIETENQQKPTDYLDKTAWMRTPQQQDPTKPRLEFLHIQKNAGSFLEVLALQHGLPWGACHFSFSFKRTKRSPLKDCPPIKDAPKQNDVFWHYPLQYLPILKGRSGNIHQPYDNNKDIIYAARPKKFFAVVRNPYTRFVSMFYMNDQRARKTHHKKALNQYVQKVIENPRLLGLKFPNATVCQYPYFYDNNGNTMVDHIVHFESLTDEFNELAREYDLPPTFSTETKIEVHNTREVVKSLSYESFSNETLKKINEACPKDFEIGRGYPRLESQQQAKRFLNQPTSSRQNSTMQVFDKDLNSPVGNETGNQNDTTAKESKDLNYTIGNKTENVNSTIQVVNKTAWIHTPQQQDPTKPRLEFLHIQKNSGTFLELLALEHGLPWGACHFNFPWKNNRGNDLKHCPPIKDAPTQNDMFWHYPRQHIPILKGPSGDIHKPYDNFDDILYTARPKKFFAVVRNPYTRLVSFFYHNGFRANHPDPTEALNNYVQNALENPRSLELKFPNATVCQYPYFYDDNGNTMVDHIVHFESLTDEFNELAREYDFPPTFSSKTKITITGRGRNRNNKPVNYENFSDETFKKINEACPKDFEIGRGYPKFENGRQVIEFLNQTSSLG